MLKTNGETRIIIAYFINEREFIIVLIIYYTDFIYGGRQKKTDQLNISEMNIIGNYLCRFTIVNNFQKCFIIIHTTHTHIHSDGNRKEKKNILSSKCLLILTAIDADD